MNEKLSMPQMEVTLVDELVVLEAARRHGRDSAAQAALQEAARRRSGGEVIVFALHGDELIVAEARQVLDASSQPSLH